MITSDDIVWRTSSFTNGTGQCVEVADLTDGRRLVRDTKDRTRLPIATTASGWTAFLAGVKAGEFD